MSNQSSRTSRRDSREVTGLPLYSSIGIIVAALITGMLISWYSQSIGWPMFAIFLVACIVVALFVNPKGIYITVASIPILFLIFIVATGWVVNQSDLPEGGDPFSTTSILMSVYPMAQYFPILAVATFGALIIGVIRLWLLKRYNQRSSERTISQRQQMARDDRENRRIAQRARARSNQVTVQELLARRENTERPANRIRRPLSDDLYDN